MNHGDSNTHNPRYQMPLQSYYPEHPSSKGYYEPYSGRFGEGFAELEPSYNSTRYCYISYWIKEEPNDESRSVLK